MKAKHKKSKKKMEETPVVQNSQNLPITDPGLPPTPPVEVKNRNSAPMIVTLIILLLVAGALGALWYKNNFLTPTQKQNELTVTTSRNLTPTPVPLHAGSETYHISQSDHKGPAVSSVTLDPLDVQKGQTLTVVVDASDSVDIKSVTGSLEMDSSKVDINFVKEGGTLKKGSWKAEIVLTDSVLYTYTLTINTTSANGLNTIKVTPR